MRRNCVGPQRALAGLDDLEACADPETLTQRDPLPADERARKLVLELQSVVEKATTLRKVGRLDPRPRAHPQPPPRRQVSGLPARPGRARVRVGAAAWATRAKTRLRTKRCSTPFARPSKPAKTRPPPAVPRDSSRPPRSSSAETEATVGSRSRRHCANASAARRAFARRCT